jgi:hypothetical protein
LLGGIYVLVWLPILQRKGEVFDIDWFVHDRAVVKCQNSSTQRVYSESMAYREPSLPDDEGAEPVGASGRRLSCV